MSLRISTSLGAFDIKLFTQDCPLICENFVRLAQIGFYNGSRIHDVEKDYAATMGLHARAKNLTSPGPIVSELVCDDAIVDDETIERRATGGPWLQDEINPKRSHAGKGLIGTSNANSNCNGSAFYITLSDERNYTGLQGKHSIFAVVTGGLYVLDLINAVEVRNYAPIKGLQIHHITVRVPLLTNHLKLPFIRGGIFIVSELLGPKIDHQVPDRLDAREASSRVLALKALRDITHDKVPENSLFICKLSPITESDDLKTIFSQFGTVTEAKIIRDEKTGQSLQYGFISFSSKQEAEYAYTKMKGAVIDNRKVIVSFSQSTARYRARPY